MIRLRRLTVRRAPGLPDGVELPSLGPGLNLVLGPNASGKSTLVRTFGSLLWPDGATTDLLTAAELESDAGRATGTLEYGRVRWDPAPPVLPPAEVRTLLSLDLRSLLDAGAADARFAQRVAVELAAGYDLEAALAALPPPSSRAGQLQRKLDAARKELRRRETQAEELARREGALRELRHQLEDARQARELARLAHDAAELAQARHELERLSARLAELPAGLDALREDDETALARLSDRLRATGKEIEKLRRRLEDDRTTAEELRLPGPKPAPHEIETWRERVRRLADTERDLDARRTALAEARSREAATRNALGSWEPPGASLPREALDRIEAALDERERLRAALREAEAAVAQWEGDAGDGDADPTAAERLGRAVEALRAWLRAAPLERVPAWPGWLAVITGATAGAVALAGLAPGAAPWLLAAGALLAGAGIGSLATRALLRRAGGTPAADTERRAAGAATAPERWEEPSVREALERAEGELDRRRLAELARRRAADARARHERARDELERAGEGLAELATSLGLAADLPDLSLVEATARVRRWIEARDAAAGAEGIVARLEEELAAGLRDLAGALEPLGYPAPADAAAAAAAVEEIAGRIDQLRDLETSIARLEDDLEGARRRASEAERDLGAFWKRTGITAQDALELRRRLELLPEHRSLVEQTGELRAVVREHATRLDREDAWSKLGLDPGELTEARARELAERYQEEAATYDELVDTIKSIETAIKAAEDGTSLEDARAEVERLAREIAERRDSAVETVLARLLIERAGEAHRQEHAPRVLERAQRLFSTFTRDAFHLEVGPDRSLRARDAASGELRTLDELSDGTRIHLLLAARLAALEETEGAAGPLPLFLDEALSTTDPRRFREIAGALLALVREGRQLIYLTADPAEVAHWREACREAGLEPPEPQRLATPEEATAGWDAVPTLDVATPDVPAPVSLDAVAYARELGIHGPDPWRPAGQWHVLYLLPDRLETVYDLVRFGVTEARVVEGAIAAGRLQGILQPADRRLIPARAALLDATLELWRRGRGRPVTWRDVTASGAVSGRFEDDVRDLVETHGRNPEAFLDAVGRLRGFRTAKLEALAEHLRTEGILPGEKPLPAEEILVRAVSRAGGALDAAGVDPNDAADYVRTLLALLDGATS